MGAGYEFRPVRVARPARRRPIGVMAVVVSLAAVVVVVKPWAPRPSTSDHGEVAAPVMVATAAAPAPSASPALGTLARHSGTWGIGSAGVGTRGDGEPWVDWVPVTPVDIEPGAEPGPAAWGDPCAGEPSVRDGPLFVAVSGPSDVPVDRRLVAWRFDGGRPVALADAIREVTTVGDTGISYLVRLDRAPWTAGRYEFHLTSDDRAVSIAVCLVPRS